MVCGVGGVFVLVVVGSGYCGWLVLFWIGGLGWVMGVCGWD